jgi:hypothetical protein
MQSYVCYKLGIVVMVGWKSLVAIIQIAKQISGYYQVFENA